MHGAVIKFVPLIHSARVPKRAIEASLALAGLADSPISPHKRVCIREYPLDCSMAWDFGCFWRGPDAASPSHS